MDGPDAWRLSLNHLSKELREYVVCLMHFGELTLRRVGVALAYDPLRRWVKERAENREGCLERLMVDAASS